MPAQHRDQVDCTSSAWRILQGGRVYGPRSEVFLVPQHVYSSMGSLADQITYPAKVGGGQHRAD